MNDTVTITLWEVGGSVRDSLLGIDSKDKDFSVEIKSTPSLSAEDGFLVMRGYLLSKGYTIFVENPEFVTLRAHFPREHPQFGKTTADFVLCRSEGAYNDGRRPDSVTAGTILEDLRRRDFRVNAMARNLVTGEFIDPHGGRLDIATGHLSCVGNATDRIKEDALRAIRAIRFSVTKGLVWDAELTEVMHQALWLPEALTTISTERISEELRRCLAYDTFTTLQILYNLGDEFNRALWCREGSPLRLEPTMAKVKGH